VLCVGQVFRDSVDFEKFRLLANPARSGEQDREESDYHGGCQPQGVLLLAFNLFSYPLLRLNKIIQDRAGAGASTVLLVP
jgi:hypothetical protein